MDKSSNKQKLDTKPLDECNPLNPIVIAGTMFITALVVSMFTYTNSNDVTHSALFLMIGFGAFMSGLAWILLSFIQSLGRNTKK